MAADSKTEKNLMVTPLVSLPKTRLRTTTGRYIVQWISLALKNCVIRACVVRDA